MEEYEVIEKDGKKVRVMPKKYIDKGNIAFIEPFIRYKETENLKYSMEMAESIIDKCNYRRPTIIFSGDQMISAMGVKILQKYYDKSVWYRIMEGTDIIASFLGESTVVDPYTFTHCDLLFINLSLTNELAGRTLHYLDVQVTERARLGKNTIVFYEGTKQGFVAKGGVLKHFTNVVDAVSKNVTNGREEIKGKSFNDTVKDRSIKRVDPYC